MKSRAVAHRGKLLHGSGEGRRNTLISCSFFEAAMMPAAGNADNAAKIGNPQLKPA